MFVREAELNEKGIVNFVFCTRICGFLPTLQPEMVPGHFARDN